MSKFALDQPIAPPTADALEMQEAERVSEALKSITLVIRVLCGQDYHPKSFSLTVTDGGADVLLPNPHPTAQDLFVVERREATDYPELATAFSSLMGAYFVAGSQGGSGTDAMMSTMAQLGIIPSGANAA